MSALKSAATRRREEQTTRVELICLANSVKLGEYCVAGIDRSTGEWVRPIGSGEHGAVTAAEQRLADGAFADLLDVVSVPVGRHEPVPGQPENHHLAAGQWRGIGRLTLDEAVQLLEDLATEDPLFGTTGKAVPVELVRSGGVDSSLAIVKPDLVEWRFEGGNKLYAEFEHAGTALSLKVTDPVFTRLFRGDAPGTYTFEDDDLRTYLTVSLPEEWRGAHWKLVAGVMQL